MEPTPQLARTCADAILVEQAERELEKGLARMRARIREAHGLFVGATIEAVVVGAVATLRLRSRRREDARLLLGLARRVQAGEDARAIAEQHLDHVLRLDDRMSAVVRAHDPALEPAKALALDLFARRLPDLARLASVEEAESYDDLVRKAFPQQGQVEAIVEDNARMVAAMVDHLERHPHVLHAPRSLTPKLAAMARDMIAWQVAEAKRGVAEIYVPAQSAERKAP
ncbi:MAG TPA: hypothetical protein VM370_07600 [Candidatus Thermoplasmatota archaeon]|nr:hypothetical protein [Candidatus Thermoplasmatota archaeon]